METLFIEKNKDGQFFEPEAYKEGAAKAWYQCPHCLGRWTERQRERAIAAGRWIAKTQQLMPDGTVQGERPQTRHYTYRANSMMIHPRFWRAQLEAAKYVAAMKEMKLGALSAFRNYTRNQKAEPWKEVARTISDDALGQRVIELERRCVPVEAKLLVAAADYHEDFGGQIRIDYEVRAFGADLINWVVLAGSVSDWEEFWQTLMLPFPWAGASAQEELYLSTVFVDSGDQTDTVYLECGRYPGWAWPIKGVESQRTPLVLTDLGKVHEQRQRRGKRRMRAAGAQGQQLVLIDQSFFSEMVVNWSEPDKQTAGATFFYKQILDDTGGAYFREFSAMHRVQINRGGHRVWTWRSRGEHTAVHFHDTARYAAAAAWFNKAHLLRSSVDATLPPALAARMNKFKAIRRVGRIEREENH
jgi:hypothetical protein